jgi:RimJ/RimL family protein N-acetyltransferase
MSSATLLRDVIASDLPILFEQQLDPEASAMAAFPSRDRQAFDAHWAKIMADETVILRTIEVNGQVTGHIVSWEMDGDREVGYWLGREFWGRGIATQALSEFLKFVQKRPLFAHVAKHNIGSRRVLEKCGFTVIGEDKYVSKNGQEIEEFVLRLGD